MECFEIILKQGIIFSQKNPDSYGGAVKFMLEVTHKSF
jgi:hypothetical protein